MPNTKSAIRRVRRVKKQTQVNRIRKSKYKNAVKQMDLLIKSKDNYHKSSRDFYIQENKSLLTIFGGKWTTSPSIARKIVTMI